MVGFGTSGVEPFLSSADVLTVWWNVIHCSYQPEKNVTLQFQDIGCDSGLQVRCSSSSVCVFLAVRVYHSKSKPNLCLPYDTRNIFPPQPSVCSVLWPLEALKSELKITVPEVSLI